MKKNTNQIMKIFSIIFTFIIVLIGMVFYKLNSNKSLKSDDVNILVATSNYVLKNNIAISDEIDIPVSLLKKQGYLDKKIYCTDDSYVSVKNVNGEYKYEPSLDCENVFIKVTSNTFYNNYTNSMRAIIETILTYEIEKSTENRTNQNVEVRIVASEPILEVSGWTLIDNDTTLVKVYETNVTNELVTLISAANNNKKEQISITVDNIDKVKPIVNGVVDGTTYNKDVTINFSKENTSLIAKLNDTTINNNYVVSEDGEYQVVVVDDIGNETIVNFTIDKTAPIVNGIENGGYYNQDVIVSFEEGTAILNNKSFISGQVVTEEGNYNFVITDNIGNSNEINFTIDKTKPNILNVEYLPILTNNRTNSDVMVEITYSEPIKFLDGIDTEWKISDENNKKIYKHFSGEMDLETNINDIVSVIDLAGNESEQFGLNFVIDKLAPTGTVTANPTTLTNGDVELVLETNEDVIITNAASSNVYQYEEGNLRKYAVKRSENGNFTFKYKDDAGNVGFVTYNVENIDKESPVVTDITYSPNLVSGYSKEDVIVTITYNEAITELPIGYEYVIDSNNKITKLYTGLENNDTVINETIKVKDIIGNVSEETNIEFTIDKTTPIVTGVENGKHYNSDVTISFNEGNATLNDSEFISGSTVTEEGSYELIVKDKAQNETTVNFVIDKTAPVVTGVENEKYYNTDVTISFNEGTAKLNGSEFISGSTVTEEGNYELIVKDNALNETTINFVIDKTAPIVTGVENGKHYNSDVTISFNEGTAKLNGSEFISGSTVTEEGNYELIVKDKAQNETTVNFVIDRTAPVVTGVENGKHYNTDVIISFNEGTATINGFEFISGSTVTEEGNYELIVKDNALNETTINFVIDKTAPTGIVTANPTTLTNGDVELVLETNEDVIITNAASSKVYQYEEGNLRKYAVKRTVNGKFTFKFKDVAGNNGKVTYVIENIDKEIPVVTDITYSPNLISGYSKEDVIVTITYNEAITELPIGYEYVIDSNNKITKLYTGLENNDTVINETIKVKDIIGNVSEETKIEFTIDKTTPIVTGVENGKHYNKDVTISFNEGTATLNDSEFISGSTVTEEGSYELIVKDKAQNETKVDFVIDKTAPVVTGVENEKYYNTDVTISFNEGNATLNGSEFISGSTVTEEGNYELIVKDNALNETTINFVIDKTAPIVTGVENGKHYNSDVTISFNEGTATLNDSEFISGSTVTEEGNYELIVKDKAQNETTVNFVIDKTAPVVTGVENGKHYNTDVTISFNEGTAKLNGFEFISGSSVTEEGNYELIVKDNALNETTINFVIDKTAPTGIVTANPTTLTNGDVELVLETSEDVIITNAESSKVYQYEEGNLRKYAVKRTVNGNFTFKFKDIAGNTARVTYNVENIDKESPIVTDITYSPNLVSGYSKEDVIVTITYNEVITELPIGYEYVIDSNNKITKLYTGLENNDTVINETIKVKDIIGNVSEETKIEFTIDKTTPIVTGVENGKHYNKDVTISFNEENATLNDSEFISGSTVTEEGSYELIVKDKAQNETTVNFVIDKTAPVVTGVENGKHYNTDVTISFNEGTAKLNGFEFISGSSVSEEGSYQLIVKDNALNETTINFVIDKTAPTGIVTANPTTLTNGDVELVLETSEDVIITNAESSKVYQYEEGNLRKYAVKRTVNGNFTFKFKDQAGNIGEITYNVENIDKESPVVTDITYSPNLISGYSKEDVIVTITYNEAITELPIGYEYVIDSNNKITKLYTGLENNDTVINETIKVKDIIGNVSEETNIEFTIDKTAPIVTGVEEGKHYNSDVTISFNEGTATINEIDFINGWKVTLEGEYQLIVRDIALNETIINFTIDKTAPVVTGVEDGKHYNRDVTINFNEGTATLNGVNLISGSNVTEEGSYQLIVKDNALNETTINFIIDKTNPNLVVFESNQNGEIEHYSDFNVNVEYSNIDKFNNYRATVNDNFSDNLEIKINGNVDLSKLGPQTIIYDVVDKAGNSSKIIATINVVDTIIPTVDYNISNTNIVSEWYNEPIIVKLNSSDIGSGVSKYEYRLIVDGIYYDWQEVEYSETAQFIIDENSSNISFIVRSYDKAGNVSLEKNSNSYKIDTIKPGLTYELQNSESSNNWYNSELKFLVNPTDNLSGISNLQYSYSVNGGTNWSEWNNLEIINLSSILTINEQTDNLAIKLRVIDNAQNEFEYVIKDGYKIDTSKPIIMIYSNDNTYTSDFTVTVEANKTGIYKLPEATVTDNYDKDIEVITSGSVDLAKVGKYEVIYSATDDANNTSKIVMTVEVKDTTSPIIKLIGNSPLKIELGHKYNEPGVVIEDNIDQNLSYSISGDVVNTNKLGTYNIVYTTLDNSGNSASVTRIVEVIPANASGLIEDINNCTSNEDCYVTQVENNYVWYSGFLWRIVKVNNDGSLKLVTEDSVSGFSYDDSSSDFESSYVNKWLNTEFYNSLNNNKNIIANSKYCIDTLLPTEEYSNETGTNNQTSIFAKQNVRYNCSNTIDLNVGLLTIDEYNILGSENSYLNTKDHFFTMTPSTAKTVWVVQTDGIQKAWNLVSNTYAIRPVITISSNIDFVSGTGTKTNPYRIENDNGANSNDLLTTRYTGEYVKFGNQTWRIVKTTGSSTKLIMDSYYQTKNDYGMLEYAKISYGNNGIYAGSNVENYLNNVVYNDLFTDKEKAVLLKSRWYYNNYAKGIDPLQSLSIQNQFVESYIGLIRIGELMSGTSSTGRVDDFTYWTANYVNDTANNKYAWFISWAGTSGYAFNYNDIRGLRPVINLNSNLTIKSGTGTASDPYILNY